MTEMGRTDVVFTRNAFDVSLKADLYRGPEAPENPVTNSFWLNTDDGTLNQWDGSTWNVIPTKGDQGDPGPTGTDGSTSYVHIAYADDASGSGFSQSPDNKDYMGTYVDFTQTDSSNPADYLWMKVKGDQGPQGLQGIQGPQGIQGLQGPSGASSYTHVAYADSATGSGFSQDPTGKTYMGVYVDHTATDSTNPSLYKWSLIQGAQGPKGDQGIPGTDGDDGKTAYLHIAYATDASGGGFSQDPTGKTYIGTYTDFTQQDSSSPSAYTWAKFQGPTGATGAQGPQGVQGPAGPNGQSLFTWVKYATSSSGAGMSDSPTGMTYIGLAYNKTTATESTNAADYTWSLIKGDTGAQGPAGANGQTTYTWVKYADNASGSGLSDSPDGKRYLGLAYNKTTATESTTASDYSWSPLYDNVQVGGTNLIPNSTDYSWWSHNTSNLTITKNTELYYGNPTWHIKHSGSFNDDYISILIQAKNGIPYTASIPYRLASGSETNVQNGFPFLVNKANNAGLATNQSMVADGDWHIAKVTGTTTDDAFNIRLTMGLVTDIDIGPIKFEQGNIATSWSPAPEDVQQGISDAASQGIAGQQAAAAAASAAGAAQTTANSKARNFTSQPAPPYSVGDTWTQSGATYYCTTARASGSYTASDWTLQQITLTSLASTVQNTLNNSVQTTATYNGVTLNSSGLTATAGSTVVTLNSTDGLKITNNGTTKFQAGTDGNVTVTGIINATGGTFSGNITSTGTITGGTFVQTRTDPTYGVLTMTLANGSLTSSGKDDDGLMSNIEISSGEINLNHTRADGSTFLMSLSNYSFDLGLSNASGVMTENIEMLASDGSITATGTITSGNVYLDGENSIYNDFNRMNIIANGGVILKDSLSGTYLVVGTSSTGNTGIYDSNDNQLFSVGGDGVIKSEATYNRTYSYSSNMYVTSNGYFGRVTSALKYKTDVEEVDLSNGYAERILQLKPKSWHDKAQLERYNSGEDIHLDRIYGLIAEDVEQVGLSEYVTYAYDENGIKETEGLQYDRLWTLLIPVVKDHKERLSIVEEQNNNLLLKIADLEARLAKLEAA